MVLLTALWLGVLTSISPCPLATNVAAVSFLSRKINHPGAVLRSGLAYTLGRMAAYMLLGVLIVYSLVSVPLVANFLQKYMNRLLGPVLIVAGLFLLGVLRLNISGLSLSSQKQGELAGAGSAGSFALGGLFALSFCPISAALFFGSLIPLAVSNPFGVTLPLVYGIGTGLPVLVFAVGVALGVRSMTHWFNKLAKAEIHMRRATGIIFIIVGVYYVWAYIVSPIRM